MVLCVGETDEIFCCSVDGVQKVFSSFFHSTFCVSVLLLCFVEGIDFVAVALSDYIWDNDEKY